MNRIVSVTYGSKSEIRAGADNVIEIEGHPVFDCRDCAVKRDQKTGREMQTMILGTGCVITWEEVKDE